MLEFSVYLYRPHLDAFLLKRRKSGDKKAATPTS